VYAVYVQIGHDFNLLNKKNQGNARNRLTVIDRRSPSTCSRFAQKCDGVGGVRQSDTASLPIQSKVLPYQVIWGYQALSAGVVPTVGAYRAPSRSVESFPAVGLLGHAKLSVVHRHAQPIAQADGFATA
jgi:hypothetical protein